MRQDDAFGQRVRRVLRFLSKIHDVVETDESKEGEVFAEVIRDIKLFSSKADSTLDTLTKADSNWFVGTFMKMIR